MFVPVRDIEDLPVKNRSAERLPWSSRSSTSFKMRSGKSVGGIPRFQRLRSVSKTDVTKDSRERSAIKDCPASWIAYVALATKPPCPPSAQHGPQELGG